MSDETTEDAAEKLQERAARGIELYVPTTLNEDGSFGFSYAGALCSVRATTLAEGLDVLSLTAVLAWDRNASATMHRRVAERNAACQFGSISAIGEGRTLDVVLRYTFPATGLNDDALITMLVLALTEVEKSRVGLVP